MSSQRQRPAEAPSWQEVLAAGLVAGDLSVPGIARYAQVPAEVAAHALDAAASAGVLDAAAQHVATRGPDPKAGAVVDGADAAAGETLLDPPALGTTALDPAALDPIVADLLGRLSATRSAQIHAAVALHLMGLGPEHFARARDHARSAGSADQSELGALLRSTGRLALAAGDHRSARRSLGAAVELGYVDGPREHRQLLLDLSKASEGCGDVAAARELLHEVIRLSEAAGDDDLVVDGAIRSALLPDWRAGDRRTAALIDLAERLHGDGPRAGAVMAARALVEMRIPASSQDVPQVAWVTRPEVAQPIARRALELTDGHRTPDRLVALGAWRWTHRGPADLERRLAVSQEAVELAHRLLDHSALVDAAVALSVDQLEAGDRAEYDETVATIRWAAATDRNPRLRWWAATISAGAALLDGDLDTAARHREAAHELGAEYDLPGWVAAEMLLAAEMSLDQEDLDELRGFLVPSDSAILSSPIARSSVALMAALLGEPDVSSHHGRIALRAVDEESSYLLCLSLLGRAASTSGDVELGAECERLLSPWTGHVAVDASAWWCSGPVDLRLAELAVLSGDPARAEDRLEVAEPAIRAAGDVRSMASVERLRRRLGSPTQLSRRRAPSPRQVAGLDALSERERDVLVLIAQGHTNAAIGTRLAYSASTIRADTVSIYRKIGVKGRAEAAALAVSAGLGDRHLP